MCPTRVMTRDDLMELIKTFRIEPNDNLFEMKIGRTGYLDETPAKAPTCWGYDSEGRLYLNIGGTSTENDYSEPEVITIFERYSRMNESLKEESQVLVCATRVRGIFTDGIMSERDYYLLCQVLSGAQVVSFSWNVGRPHCPDEITKFKRAR